MKRLFKNGSIAKGDSNEFEKADVLVGEWGTIELVAPEVSADTETEVVDCEGCLLVPGMFDLNVRAREPGFEHKETLVSCAEAALNGGVTGCVLMPDTAPPTDSGTLVKAVQDLVSENSPIPMLVSGCLTKKREGQAMAGFSGMVSRGVPMLTDSGNEVQCPDLLRRCMEYARDFDVLVACHCNTSALTKAGAVNEGPVSYRLGLPGIPTISQEIAIDRDIRVAGFTNARLHLQQVSTRGAVRSVAAAKADGVRLTCEVSPHHLLMSEEYITDYDTKYKLDPPLRCQSDVDAMLRGLIDGTIDAIASDHSPHTEFEKSSDFASAPFGVSGLDTTVLALYDGFIKPGYFGWDLLIQRYSIAPRKIAGVDPVSIKEGEKADFFVFDPNAETAITREYLKTKSPVTPFLGRTLAGAIRQTVVGDFCFAK